MLYLSGVGAWVLVFAAFLQAACFGINKDGRKNCASKECGDGFHGVASDMRALLVNDLANHNAKRTLADFARVLALIWIIRG